MASLFSAPKMPPVPTAITAPSVTDPSVAQAARDQATAAAQAAGRASTIATSGQGDTSTPDTARTTLLGGGRAFSL